MTNKNNEWIIMESYNVIQIEKNTLKINGKGNHPLWAKANNLTNFCSPWDSNKFINMQFKALWDTDMFFFCFEVNDPEVYIDTTDNSKSSINNSDRVELFFRINDSLNPYYCLEIDPSPRIMDFKAHPNKQFDFKWNWPSDDIEVKSSLNANGYVVEGAISILSLARLDLLKQGKMETGIYRAKYYKQTDGTYKPLWSTWINPDTTLPNFHIASSFGILHFVEKVF